MSFATLSAALEAYRVEHPEQRTGQAYFNALHNIDPELADEIRTTDADPFYDDQRLQYFFARVLDKYFPTV